MITIHHLIVTIAILLPLTTSLRESDLGKNDWSIQNIGKIQQISFPQFNHDEQSKHNRQVKNLFFSSELGLFGLLDRKTGQIQTRESLFEGEYILGSDDKQITISTQSGQIVIYNKYTLRRTVDNRAMSKDFKNINSYVKTNNKVYVANNAIIKQFEISSKKHEELASIQAPTGFVILKTFSLPLQTSALYALIYNERTEEVCLDTVDAIQSTTSHKKCVKAKLDQSKYVKFYQNSGNVFFGDSSQHFYLNINTLEQKTFHSKPVHWSQNQIRFENGLVFTSKGSSDEKLFPVQSNTKDKIYQGEVSSSHLIIYQTTSGSKGEHLTSLNIAQKKFKISKIWLHFLSQTEYEILVQFEDLELVMYTNQGREFKQLWSRDQSLAYVEKVLFMKYQGYTDHLNTPYHMKMGDPQYIALSFVQKIQQIHIHFVSRIKSELQDIYNFVIQKFEGVVKTFTHKEELQELFDVKGYLKSTMSTQSEKKYGLQKYIIVITAYNTMFSIDTKTSNIIWKKKYGNDLKLVGLIKLKQEYEKQIAIAISYKYHITYITQIHEDGTLTELQEFQTFCEPTVHKISAHSILLRANQKIHRFDINKDLFGAEKQYGFYSVEEDRKVVGWKIVNENLIQTWSMEIPQTEIIINTTAAYRGQPEANLPLNNDKKVLFKNVDFSNLAVLTLQNVQQQATEGGATKPSTHRLKLYLVNGLTGTIQFNEFQTGINPNLPIRLLYDEHNAIVTYYSLRNRVFQIWTIEAFQMPEQSQLLSKPYAPVHQRGDITFKSKVYGTVLPIKNIFISESKQALLRRNLIIITRENKIYSLPREMISTRRPKSADADANANSVDAEFISSKYPMEEYILPVNTLGFLNYNKKLSELNIVRFSSSDLQSTIFMMAYGIDLFLVRVAPDKAFDMLADGFNYLQLIAIMIAVTFAAIFFKNKAKEAKLRKLHLD